MTVVVALSSYVAVGSVGLRAAHAAFEGSGIRLIAVPTILLTAHLGHSDNHRHVIPAHDFSAFVSTIPAQLSAQEPVAVMTGFMPEAVHVEIAADFISRLKATHRVATVLIDPIMGDDPHGLYVADAVAAAIKDRLVTRADVLTPNRFELSWLSGLAVRDETSAVVASRSLSCPTVVATSIPVAPGNVNAPPSLATVRTTADAHDSIQHPKLESRAHGTGDLFAAILVREVLNGKKMSMAATTAASIIVRQLEASGTKLDIDLSDLRTSMQSRSGLELAGEPRLSQK